MKIKKNVRICKLFILCLFAFNNTFSQDYHFSQFRETPMLINPAQTALNKDVRIIVINKDQWRSVAAPFKTFLVSGELAINHKRGKNNYLGVGIQLMKDQAGDAKIGSTLGLLSLNGIVKINSTSKLSLGIVGGMGQRTINAGALKWGSQYDGTNYNAAISSGEVIPNSTIYPDLGAGIAWSYGKGEKYISAKDGIKATVGFSAFHLGVPNYSYYQNMDEKLHTKMIGHASVSIGLANTNLLIIPELIFVKQGSLTEINFGSIFKYIGREESKHTGRIKASAISIGTHYRLKDAFIITGLYEYSNYAIGLSYDANLSKLTHASSGRGGFEVSLRFVTPNQFSSNRSRI